MIILGSALALIVGLGMAYAAASVFGAWRWSVVKTALTARLDAANVPPPAGRYRTTDLAGLPAPVQRYFSAALTDGQRYVSRLTLHQRGTFNVSLTAAQWRPFTATQHFTVTRPGFVWDAQILMFPGMPVGVVDAHIAGEGLLRPAILGLLNMGTQQGRGEIAYGELMRHFAESVWFPTALPSRQGLIWRAADDTSASATVTDGPLSVTLLFRFGTDGLITSIYADSRTAQVGKTTVMMPWECRMSNDQTQGGMRVPMTGEVVYLSPQGERPYFKGTNDALVYVFAD